MLALFTNLRRLYFSLTSDAYIFHYPHLVHIPMHFAADSITQACR